MKWFKDAIRAAKQARSLRKMGYTGYIDVRPENVGEQLWVPRNEYDALEHHSYMVTRNLNHAYDCIEHMGKGGSRCKYCMNRDTCIDGRKGRMRGCPEWALSYPEVENAAEETEMPAEDLH